MKVGQYKILLREETGFSYLRKQKTLDTGDVSVMNTVEVVESFAKDVLKMHIQAEEEVYAIYVNTKCKPLGVSLISHGVCDASILRPREVILRGLLMGASGFILMHNHPSQDSVPSHDDISSTKRLKEACSIVGISFLDHVIIGTNSYSMKSNGYL